jgi:hypothetical protein
MTSYTGSLLLFSWRNLDAAKARISVSVKRILALRYSLGGNLRVRTIGLLLRRLAIETIKIPRQNLCTEAEISLDLEIGSRV